MRILLAFLLVAFSSAFIFATELPRSTPETQGVSSEAVLQFVNEADKSLDSLHSFMLVRHGHVVAEGWWTPYRAEAPHALYSLSKSFTSTAVGLAIAEGKLSVDLDRGATPGSERRLGRKRYVHGEDLFLRDTLCRHGEPGARRQ